MSDNDCLHVSLDTVKGCAVIDVRVFSRFTPARVMMPTRHAIAVAPGLVPELVAALKAAARANSGLATAVPSIAAAALAG